MTLQRHLTIVVTLLLGITMATFAWLLVRTTRVELMKQLDDAVIGAAARDAPFPTPAPGQGRTRPRAQSGTVGEVNGGRRVARLLYSPSGELLNYEPSGFADQPDPIVRRPAIRSPDQRRMVDRLVDRTL